MDKKCPHCGSNMPEEASFCLKCFSQIKITPIEITNIKDKKPNALPIIITLILILSVAAALIIKTTGSKSDDNIKNTVLNSKTITNEVTRKATTISTTEQTTLDTTTAPTTTKPTTEKTTAATTESTTIAETTTKKATTSAAKSTTKKAKATTAPAKIVINGSTLTDYPASKKSTSYTIPYKVTKISDNAFNGNKYLKSLKFSKREKLDCNYQNLFSSLPNLETVYVYPGTDADLIGLQYFDGEIVYYD